MPPVEISLLSAGAVKPGLVNVVDGFRRDSGHRVHTRFATAPSIIKRMNGGEAVDVVIAPPTVLDELAEAGKIDSARTVIGRIGVGVLVHASAPLPKIATVDDFKRSLEDADSLVYNQASTGIYLESLLEGLGIGAQVKSKSIRYPDFAAVLDHMSNAGSREIGFGATTVIAENVGMGIKLVGALPEGIQNYTTYAAALTATAGSNAAARRLIGYFVTSAAKSLFADAGID